MKKDLVALIEAIPNIESKFKKFVPSKGVLLPSGEFIYDVPEFIEWKQAILYELQDIYDRTHDTFVWRIINATGIIHKFNGRNGNERKYFNELKGSLTVIRKNINKYYPDSDKIHPVQGDEKSMKKAKIFISHSSKDIETISKFVDLLADMGLTSEELFCSSVPDYSIPLSEDIYDYLASLFRNYDIYVIFMLSRDYYNSPACLNEMGAAWVLKSDYTSILLPGFSYQEIKGAVNPNKIGFKLDDEDEFLKKRLGELIHILADRTGKKIDEIRWEKKRNDFIEKIKEPSQEKGGIIWQTF